MAINGELAATRVKTSSRSFVLSLSSGSSFPWRVRQILAVVGSVLICATTGLAQTYRSVTLSWDASPDTNVAGYRIYIGPSSGNYTNSIDVGNLTSGTVPLLAGGGTYYFVVSAYSSEGFESDFSNEVISAPLMIAVTLVASGAAPPDPPRPEVSLQWNSVPGATYHILYRNNLSDTNWTDLNTTIVAFGTNTSWSEPVQSAVVSRFYCVVAVH
jgi:hypothetical protein